MNNYNYMNYYRLYRSNPKTSNSIYNPYEGFIKGNIFENLYSTYKNYTPINLRPKSEREKDYYNLLSIDFMINDLNLYLDLHPTDTSILTLYKDYTEKYKNLVNDYENKYGPLTSLSINNDREFTWIKNWSWEVDNV